MIRTLIVATAALTTATVSTPAAAYWDYGHRTVADIAWANVSPRTRTAVTRILRAQGRLDTPGCPVRTIADASVWPDCIKPLKDAQGRFRFGYAYSWHYQNVNICVPFTLEPACKDGNCVSAQIPRQQAILKNRRTPMVERVRALAFLVHFVGDLHQPLHAGDKADKGGNDAKSDYGIYAPARLNLHTIWDGLLAERAISTPPALVRHYPAAMRAKLGGGDAVAWSHENWAVAREAYATAMHGDPCQPTPARLAMTDADIASLGPLEREQIRRGGLRLAKLLDAALG